VYDEKNLVKTRMVFNAGKRQMVDDYVKKVF
jgi:hypothetical protein